VPPRVTVIIATYNWSTVLPYSIGSVLGQTFTDFELLVVGDGCTDDSESVVAAIGDPRVRWINLPVNTRHQSGPNNEGLRQARGELIAYLGHDDLWLPDHLAPLVEALDSTGVDLAYSLCLHVAANERVGRPAIPRPEKGSFASPLSVVHRRRVTEEMGGWRHYRELDGIPPDVELWRRMRSAGHRFTFVPRLTGIKFPASWRRDVYADRPCHEQAVWLARIESEPDLEARELVNCIVAQPLPIGLPYREILRFVVHETASRLRSRLSLRSPWQALRRGPTIDDLRRFKGL
jgi:glycosyltransferase involved in cell wall biosynthesis